MLEYVAKLDVLVEAHPKPDIILLPIDDDLLALCKEPYSKVDKIIYQPIRLECDVKRAFEMFIPNKHIEKWLAQVAAVEPEVGGK